MPSNPTSPRVAVVSRSGHGGHPRYCAELAKALSDQGAEVTLIEPAEAFAATRPIHERSNVTNTPISSPSAGWLRQEIEIAKALLTQRKSGGIVVFQDTSAIRVPLVALLRWASAWEPVSMVHNTRAHNESLRERLKHAASMATLAIPHRVLTHNARQRAELAALPLVPSERVDLVPHGVWTTGLAESATTSSGSKKLLMFGVMRDNSGLDEVLRIAPDLDREFPELRLDIVGKPTTPTTERLLSELDAFNTIHVRPEFVTEQEAADLFAASHTTLLPYVDYSSESGVLMTALAEGHFIVTWDRSSVADVVRQFSLGPEPTNSLLDAIREALLANDDQREAWMENAAEARRHFSWTEHARRIIDGSRSSV